MNGVRPPAFGRIVLNPVRENGGYKFDVAIIGTDPSAPSLKGVYLDGDTKLAANKSADIISDEIAAKGGNALYLKTLDGWAMLKDALLDIVQDVSSNRPDWKEMQETLLRHLEEFKRLPGALPVKSYANEADYAADKEIPVGR